MRGGDSGSPLVPGKPDESPFILQIEGRAKPKMPPKKDLPPDEVAVLRAWVAAGAPYSKATRVSIDEKVPALTQTATVLPQVTSLAWRPDGQQLAVAGYKQVHRLAMPGGTSVAPLTDLSDLVRAVAWSPDGSMIAAGGGTPGAFGEIVVFDAATGAARVRLEGHRDYVYHLAFNHDGTRLASCGYDKVIRVWDTATGKAVGVLKEHTEARVRGGVQRRRRAVGVCGRRSVGEDLERRRRRAAVHHHRPHRRGVDAGVSPWHPATGGGRAGQAHPRLGDWRHRGPTRCAARPRIGRRCYAWRSPPMAARSPRREPTRTSGSGTPRLASRFACWRGKATGRRRWPSVPMGGNWPWGVTTAPSASTMRCLAGPFWSPSRTRRWHDDEHADSQRGPERHGGGRLSRGRPGDGADPAGGADQPDAVWHSARHDGDLHRRRREPDGRRRGDLQRPRPVGADHRL